MYIEIISRGTGKAIAARNMIRTASPPRKLMRAKPYAVSAPQQVASRAEPDATIRLFSKKVRMWPDNNAANPASVGTGIHTGGTRKTSLRGLSAVDAIQAIAR